MQRLGKYMIIAGVIGALVLGVIGLLTFTSYGGNSCDQPPAMTCDCFCCSMFDSRGYESCGMFGLWAGIAVGAILGVLIAYVLRPRHVRKKRR